ncbi:heavy metal transporter [Flavobacteriales bacterium 34_180_T64]|nr:heavy metal transporter [Flavobacteriales bacterium 34_180_T64]
MKTFKNLLVVAIVAVTVMACKNEAKPDVKTVETETAAIASNELDPNANYAKAEFSIDGMTCAIGCAKTIEKKMAKMEGVKSATVDFDKQLAMVEYDEAKVTHASLEEAVAKAGETYKVTNMKTVEAFSTEEGHAAKMGDKKACKADCTKACCAEKTDAEKKACKADCKKECCSKKDKA